MLKQLEEGGFDPAKAVTLNDWVLENHDVPFDDDRLVEWAKEYGQAVADGLEQIRMLRKSQGSKILTE